MKVALLTITQKNKLINKEFADDNLFNPIQDLNNNWVISLEELEAAKSPFLWVKELNLIDFLPKVEAIK